MPPEVVLQGAAQEVVSPLLASRIALVLRECGQGPLLQSGGDYGRNLALRDVLSTVKAYPVGA